jgi:hypothetical protein
MIKSILILVFLYVINVKLAYSSSCFLTYFEDEELQRQRPCKEYIKKNKEFFRETPIYSDLKNNNKNLTPEVMKKFLDLKPNDYFVMASKEYEKKNSTFRKNIYKNGNPHNIPKKCLKYCRDTLLVTDIQLHSCYKVVKKKAEQSEPKYCQEFLYHSIQKKSEIGATLLVSDTLTSEQIEPSLSIECPGIIGSELKVDSNKKDPLKENKKSPNNSIDKSAKMLIANLFGGCEALKYKVNNDPEDPEYHPYRFNPEFDSPKGF